MQTHLGARDIAPYLASQNALDFASICLFSLAHRHELASEL